jgi:hypothetical protein
MIAKVSTVASVSFSRSSIFKKFLTKPAFKGFVENCQLPLDSKSTIPVSE